MRIAFLCSSIDPGADGVGDYARQLASACSALGHSTQLIGLHEPGTVRGDRPTPGETRFSAAEPWGLRADRLRQSFEEFNPDWVSWQLVPYGFHPKGIIPDAAAPLLRTSAPYKRHVMLHELWIGMSRGESFRSRIIGSLQRRQLMKCLRLLSPSLLSTTNATYQAILDRLGWNAEVLPLFGNIPLSDATAGAAELSLISGDEIPPGPRWIATLFGTIHPQWNHAPTLSWLERASAIAGRHLVLLSIGRAGGHGDARLAQIKSQYPKITVVCAGIQSQEAISHLLRVSDFGIATHPWALIGKSGSTLALREHGLPVLVPRNDWVARSLGSVQGPNDPLIVLQSDLAPEAVPAWIARRSRPESILPGVTRRFVTELANTSSSADR